MFMIEPFEYASDFVKKAAAANNRRPKAYAVIRIYDADSKKYPNLRDRTDEMVDAVTGISKRDRVSIFDYTGKELHSEFGFEAVGAQFGANYRLIFS